MATETPAPDVVLYARDGGVARITLNRPDRRNALNGDLLASLGRRLDEAASDPAVRAILLTGSGSGFCAGQDLNDRDPRLVAWPLALETIQEEAFHPVIRTMRASATPIVAAVHGVASGAGVSLALAADIVIAADDSRFVLSFARVGLSVDAGCGWFMVKALGGPRARALLLTGGAVSGAEAAAMGLVFRSAPAAEVLGEAAAVADALASGPAVAHGLIKRALAAAEAGAFDAYLRQ